MFFIFCFVFYFCFWNLFTLLILNQLIAIWLYLRYNKRRHRFLKHRSMSRVTSVYGRTSGSSSLSRRNQQSTDFFPLLSSKEIALCLQSCNINVTEENISKPTSQFTQHLFIDLIPPEFLSTTLNKKLEKFQKRNKLSDNDYFNEISQSLPIIALQRELYDFMRTCGITDFNFMDVYKPETYRLSRILSAVVNFARFKYERSNDYQDLIDISEEYLVKRNQLIDESQNLMTEIEMLTNKHTNAQEKINEINEYQSKIQKDLKELKSVQDKLSQEHLNYKTRRNELINQIQLENENIIHATQENDSVKNLIAKIDLKNPENTKNEINDYRQNLANLKIKLTNLDDKERKIQITIDSMKYIENDIKILINLINSIKNDLKTSKEQQSKLIAYNEVKDFKNNELLNLNRKIQQVQQQIDNVNSKISRYSKQRQEKVESHTNKMKELQNNYSRLMVEKKLKDKDLGNKKTRLEDLDTQIKKLINEFDEELNDSDYQIKLLWQHIEIYMKKMSAELGQAAFV